MAGRISTLRPTLLRVLNSDDVRPRSPFISKDVEIGRELGTKISDSDL